MYLYQLGTFAKRVVGGGRKESAEDAARYQQLQHLVPPPSHTLCTPARKACMHASMNVCVESGAVCACGGGV